MTETAEKKRGGIRSVNIPRDVRDSVREEAKARGISASALSREIMAEYVSGRLQVPDTPGPQLVSTSIWINPDLWASFTAKSERNGHSTQWIFRSWLDRENTAG